MTLCDHKEGICPRRRHWLKKESLNPMQLKNDSCIGFMLSFFNQCLLLGQIPSLPGAEVFFILCKAAIISSRKKGSLKSLLSRLHVHVENGTGLVAMEIASACPRPQNCKKLTIVRLNWK